VEIIMSLFNVFNVSGSALNAETIRLNTTASNLANAESLNGDASKVYRARHPVFQAMMNSPDTSLDGQDAASGVRVLGIVESAAPPLKSYQPDHPLADKDGYVYASNVNSIEEMTNMISANRSFATNVQAINTARDLLLKVIAMGH
jgi:flagellar basal-body rod protein FlgC